MSHPERQNLEKKRAMNSGKQDQDQEFHAMGKKQVVEIMAAEPDKVDVVYLQKDAPVNVKSQIIDACRKAKLRYSLVPRATLDKLFAGNHQGVGARLYAGGFVALNEALHAARKSSLQTLLALDMVQDTGNTGTIARTFFCLGGAAMVLPRHNAAAMGSGAVKASAGAIARLSVCKAMNLARALDEAREEGFHVYGASMEGESVYEAAFGFPAILVLGNEEKGVRPGVAKRCERMLSIPLEARFDSLNVAQAGAIMLGFMRAARNKALDESQGS